jgi:hypothetical protein
MCGGLDLLHLVLCRRNFLRQPSDSVAKRSELSAIGKLDHIFECPLPTVSGSTHAVAQMFVN